MKELAIRSPSNVSIDYPLAGLLERSIAFVTDLLAILLLCVLAWLTVGRVLLEFIGSDHFLTLFIFVFLPMLIGLAGFTLSEYYLDGQTPGKKMMGLRTIRIDGASPTFETYALRAAMLVLDFMASFGALGLLAAGASPYRQRIGDRIAQTTVISSRLKPLYRLDDILGIRTVDDHEVVYARARELTIEQALFVKRVVVQWERQRTEEVSQIVLRTSQRLAAFLELDRPPTKRLAFLKQVLRDYIVLTR